MTEYNNVLKSLMDLVDNQNIEVSNDEYEVWKKDFESMPEHDKVFNLLGVLSQYLTSGCKTSAHILAIAVICTNRWCNEKDHEEFLRGM